MILLQPNKKAGGDKYSAFAIFKNQQEANQAFESINGDKEKVCSRWAFLSSSLRSGSSLDECVSLVFTPFAVKALR